MDSDIERKFLEMERKMQFLYAENARLNSLVTTLQGGQTVNNAPVVQVTHERKIESSDFRKSARIEHIKTDKPVEVSFVNWGDDVLMRKERAKQTVERLIRQAEKKWEKEEKKEEKKVIPIKPVEIKPVEVKPVEVKHILVDDEQKKKPKKSKSKAQKKRKNKNKNKKRAQKRRQKKQAQKQTQERSSTQKETKQTDIQRKKYVLRNPVLFDGDEKYDEKEDVKEPKEEPGFTKHYGYNKTHKGPKYILKIPEDFNEQGIEFILDSIQIALDDVKNSYPDFRPMKYICQIRAEIKSNNEEEKVKDRFVRISVGEYEYPKIDKNNARRFIRMQMEKYEQSDKWLEILEIELYLIPSPVGGCYIQEGFSEDFKCVIIDGEIKLKNPKTKNNNCLFYCFKHEFKNMLEPLGLKFGIGYCDTVRAEYGLKKGTKIDIPTAKQIIKDKLNLDVGVINDKKEYFSEGCDVTLMLVNEHYMRVDAVLQKCKRCGDTYWKDHDDFNCMKMMTFEANAADETKRFPIPQRKRPLVWDKITEESNGTLDERYYILHYDIEAYKIDEHGTNQPNCLGFAYYDTNKQPQYEVIIGEDCMDRFASRLRDKDLLHTRFVNAFYGRNYDHLLLIQAERKYASLARINPLKTPSGIIQAGVGLCPKFNPKKGEYPYTSKEIVDISAHLVGTLKSNLEDLKCEVQKGSFDHEKNGPWNTLSDEVKSDLLKYLKADVMGLMELSNRIHQGFMDKFQTSWVHTLSTGQCAYNLWMHSVQEKYIATEKILLPTSDEYDNWIKPSIFGGRCQVHRKYFKSSDIPEMKFEKITDIAYRTDLTPEQLKGIKDYFMDLDVTSLYPKAMTYDLPIGIPFKTNEYHKDKLGIYKVKFTTNKKLVTSPLPRRGENGELFWDLIDGEGTYTNIDIENAMSFGYKFEIISGLVWPERAPVFKDYIEERFTEKDNNPKGTTTYMLAKLMMNSPYGKTLQKPRDEKVFFVNSRSQWDEIFTKYRIDFIDSTFDDDEWIVYCTAKDKSLKEKAINKPAHFGSFILSYSRKIMMDYIRQINPEQKIDEQFAYTDTDSIQCHINQASKIDMSQKGLGFMSNDLGPNARIIEGIWVSPKMYLLRYLTIDKENPDVVLLKEHRVGKGVKKISKNIPISTEYAEKFSKIVKDAGKGVIPLNESDYKTMLSGGKLEVTNKDVFKRFAYNLNNSEKSKGTNYFSVSIRDCKKELNKHPWKGREFDDNLISVPIGYAY